jgi:membrane-associated protease RseP (regulator of RpoE activity)
MSFDLISAVLFYVVIGVVIYIKRDRIEFIERIIPVYRTERPLKFMKRVSSFGTFWKVFSTMAIPIAFMLMVAIVALLLQNAFDILVNPQSAPGVAPLIPGVKIPGSPIYIPFWEGIIAIGVLAVVHEFSHGITAFVEGVGVKSSGFGMFLIFPLAFVEMNEAKMKEASRLSRLRIISVASVANVAFAFLLAFTIPPLMSPFIMGVTEFDGVTITSVVPDMPASGAGITEGTTITSVGDYGIFNTTGLSEAMATYTPGENVTLATDRGEYTFTLAENPDNSSKGYMGLYFEQSWKFTQESQAHYPLPLLQLVIFSWFALNWIVNINIMVGMMNLFPMWVVDGGQMVYNFLGYFIKDEEKIKKICNVVFYLMITILLINFLPNFF